MALHTLGATLSAAAFGAVLGGVGAVLSAPWGRVGFVAVTAIAVAYAARELLGVPIPLPNLERQVPEWWRTFFSPPTAALLYGLGLGVGFLTYLSFGTLVAVAAAAVAMGSPLGGVLVMAPFGLARGLSVLAARSADTEDGVSRAVERLDRLALSGKPKVVNGVALVGIAGAAAAAALGSSGSAPAAAAPWLLGGLFAWAALAKLLRPGAWRRSLEGYVLGPLRPIAFAAVPISELAVTALLIAGLHRGAGALAVSLLAGFSLAVLRARRLAGDRVPCGCFGRARTRDFRLLLLRNGLIAALAAAVIVQPPSVGLGLHGPGSPEVLPTLLAAAGGVVAVLLVRASAKVRDRYRA